MYKYEKTQKNLLFAVCGILLILHPLIIHSQEIDEKIAALFLSESDMPGYEILRTDKSKWWSYNTDYISQTWIVNGTEERDGKIDIAVWEFDSMWDAVYDVEISIGPKAQAAIYIWGSPIGSIRADESWYLVGFPVHEITIFVRGNICIGIRRDTEISPDDITIEYLVSKMLAKVEQNLDPAILSLEENARAKQISRERFGQFTDTTVQSEKMSGYSKSTEWDSKWLVDENTFAMGRRTEWKTDSGAVLGVDICEFDSEEAAQKAVEFHTRPFGVPNKTRFFDMNNPASLDSLITNWDYYNWNVINGICVKGNTAMQVYYYDPGGLDQENFKAIVSDLSASLSF